MITTNSFCADIHNNLFYFVHIFFGRKFALIKPFSCMYVMSCDALPKSLKAGILEAAYPIVS
jgi:hypothetical protein